MRKALKKYSCAVACFCTMAAMAQPADSSIIKKITAGAVSHLPEKIFVHTDKELYLAGEIMWFKLYTVDGFFNKPISLSKVAYAELVDANNKAVLQSKISLKEQEDNGSFQLPLQLPSGNYTFRAYTAWMKPNGINAFFTKTITIINPLKDPAEIVQSVPQHFIDFFPEGGDMVAGMENNIAFKMADKNGNGINGNGYVVNEMNDTVAKFSTLKFGIGRFSFTPQKGMHYKALLRTNGGKQFEKQLPAAVDNGYAIRLNEEADGRIRIALQTNAAGNHTVFLLAQARQLVTGSWRFEMINGKGGLFIDKKNLKEGITQFTVFNDRQEPLCERLYFIKPSAHSNISVGTNSLQYTKRQQVQINLQGYTSEALNLSLSVYKTDSLHTDKPLSMEQYLWLVSGLKGKIESPEYYFSNDSLLQQATDNLMLTHGWRRFAPDVTQKNAMQPFPEYAGHIIGIRVTDRNTKQPVSNTTVYLTVPGTSYNFYTAETSQTGIAQFEVLNLYGNQQLVFQAGSGRHNEYQIELINPFSENDDSTSDDFMNGGASALLEKYSIAMQVNNIYNQDSLSRYLPPFINDTNSFFGKPDFSYELDNYKRFTTMEEVLREYVLPITLLQRNGKLHVRMYNGQKSELHEDNLLFLLDGLYIPEPAKILNYDPLLVKKLEIIPREYKYGNKTFEGVANFSTYKNNFEGFNAETFQVSIDYEGLRLQREFYSPSYETAALQASRKPDYRTTLYWNPNVRINGKNASSVNFYTGDIKGRYVIILQGIDKNGNTVAAQNYFEVK